jgi:hypothetical protein
MTDFARWQDGLREPSLSVLLAVQIIVIFVIGPMADDGILNHWSTDIGLLVLALVSFFVAAMHGMARVLILLAIIAMLALAGLRLFVPTGDSISLAVSGARSLFLVSVTFVLIAAVFRAGPVSLHRIQGGIAIYLNIALLFAFIYVNLAVHVTNAFSTTSPQEERRFGEMLYFSLTTLTTTGYGDIVPVNPLARSLANLESIIGQLFPATLIAALVGLHLTRRQK